MITLSDILEMIDPVDPDNLKPLGNWVFEALWSPASPFAMDIELLKRTEGIEVIGNWYAPSHLPNWTAIQFKVTYES